MAVATPDQLTISDVASETGLTNHTLRYYERAGLLNGVGRNDSGHRRYTSADVEWVVLVTRLRATGMPIRKIRRTPSSSARARATRRSGVEILESHRAEVVAKIAELQHNLELIDYKLGLYRECVSRDSRA